MLSYFVLELFQMLRDLFQPGYVPSWQTGAKIPIAKHLLQTIDEPFQDCQLFPEWFVLDNHTLNKHEP